MAYAAGEYQIAEGDVSEAVAWFLVYYQAGGLLAFHQEEDPGGRQAQKAARSAFSGGSGEPGPDVLWAIKLAHRWPGTPPDRGADYLVRLIEEKEEEVGLRGGPGAQGAAQRDPWGQRRDKGVVTVQLQGKEGSDAAGSDAWSSYKGPRQGWSNGKWDSQHRNDQTGGGGAWYGGEPAPDKSHRRGGGRDGPDGSGDRRGTSSWRMPAPENAIPGTGGRVLPGDWTCSCGYLVFARHNQCGVCQKFRDQATRIEDLEPGQQWCANPDCAIVLHRGHAHCFKCGSRGTEHRPGPPGPSGGDEGAGAAPKPQGPPPGRRAHVQGPPVQDVQSDIRDCLQWMQAILVPDKPAGILPGWPEKPGHVDVYRLVLPGGVSVCLPGLDSAKVARMWDLDAGDLMQALQQDHTGGVGTDAGPTFYLGQLSHGAGYAVLLMPKWVAGLDLWSDGTLGPAGTHAAGLPLSALLREGRRPLRQQPVPTAGATWPHPPRERLGHWEKPEPPQPLPLGKGTPGPPPSEQSGEPAQGRSPVPHWQGPGKVDEEAKDLVLGPGLIARMGGARPAAKKLAASHWRVHKRPAGRDCYGAPDPSFVALPDKRAEDRGGGGGGRDPWANGEDDRHEAERREMHLNILRLQRVVADQRLKLDAFEQEEAATRILQRGDRTWANGDRGAEAQRGGGEQHPPVHAHYGAAGQAGDGGHRCGDLSSMS